MAQMTEEEADELDELLTRTTPEVDFSKPGIFARQRELLSVLNSVASDSCAGAYPAPWGEIVGGVEPARYNPFLCAL
jgi:hypothetical protein